MEIIETYKITISKTLFENMRSYNNIIRLFLESLHNFDVVDNCSVI